MQRNVGAEKERGFFRARDGEFRNEEICKRGERRGATIPDRTNTG